MSTVILVENLSKAYQLGTIGTGTLVNDIRVWWAKARGKPNPVQKINQREHGNREGETVWALRDVNFTVRQGEAVGIIGRNGAGKSTLLKILSQITAPTLGMVKTKGRIASLLEVGTGFHPELTGRENIYLNGTIMGMNRAEVTRKLDEIVAFSGVEQFIDTPVKRYSSGMYVRLAFAVAAHLDPEILVVDEVLAVGDAEFQKKSLGKMDAIAHEGRTVLFVSHNIAAIQRLCPRAILLARGKIAEDGPSHQVSSKYLDAGLGRTAEREWSTPSTGRSGNNMVSLRAVRVLNEAGSVADIIDIRECIKIEIEYDNFAHPRFPYANIQLINEDGVCILTSGDFVNQEWRYEPRDFTGRVVSTCTIPGNFLAEGRINVTVVLTTHKPREALVVEPDAVSFVVLDNSQGDGARGELTGHFPGVVRPLLDWKINYERLS